MVKLFTVAYAPHLEQYQPFSGIESGVMRVSRLKTTYQRNILISQGIVLFLSGVAFCWLSQLGPPTEVSELYELSNQKVIRQWVEGRPTVSSTSANVPSGPGSGIARSGREVTYPRMGNPVVISNGLSAVNQLRRSSSFSIEDSSFLSGAIDDDGTYFAGPNYEDDGYFGTAVYGMFDLPEERSSELLSQPVRLVVSCDPDYPLIAADAGKEGEVEFLVLIDSTGRPALFWHQQDDGLVQMIDHLLLREEPPDWFFAQKAWESIETCQFSPRVEDGRAVSTMVRLTCYFCLSFECHAERIIVIEQT